MATMVVLQYFRNIYSVVPRVISYSVSSDDGQSRYNVADGPTTLVVVTEVDCALVVVGVSLVLDDGLVVTIEVDAVDMEEAEAEVDEEERLSVD